MELHPEQLERDPNVLKLFKDIPRTYLRQYEKEPKRFTGYNALTYIYTRLRYGYLLFKTNWNDDDGQVETIFAEAFEALEKITDVWNRMRRRVLKDDPTGDIGLALDFCDIFQEESTMKELKQAYVELLKLREK